MCGHLLLHRRYVVQRLRIFHGITRHWGTLSPKAHRWAPFYCVVVPLHLILALVWDLLRATLLVVTWPVWWLHEEVLGR